MREEFQVRQYRKQPVQIEAVRYQGSSTHAGLIQQWMAGTGGGSLSEAAVLTRDIRPMEIDTLEGIVRAKPGDWIVKGVEGEFYPVRDAIFRKTYEVPDE